jgi:molecular chaperone GrpE
VTHEARQPSEESPEVIEEVREEEQDQVRELEEKYLRLRADFDNYRRRTQQEKESLWERSAAQIIEQILPVIDDLERALEVESADPALKEGVQMICRRLLDILGQAGLAPIEAIGEPFDPNLHDAVDRENGEAEGEDIVVAQYRRGYCFKDKLLRASMVKVGKTVQAHEGDEQK